MKELTIRRYGLARICFGLVTIAVGFVLSSCAPTENQIRGANLWRNYGETIVPPIPPPPVKPVFGTARVEGKPGDAVFYQPPNHPEKTVMIGLDQSIKGGGIYVFGMDGKIIQQIRGPILPVSVDVMYSLEVDGQVIDLVAVLDRFKRELLVYRIDRRTLHLTDVSGNTFLFDGLHGVEATPCGSGLYRGSDGTGYAMVMRKATVAKSLIWQYKLVPRGGKFDLAKVRAFGDFSNHGEPKALTVDNGLGYVYYYDSDRGIRKYEADPDHAQDGRELGTFGQEGWTGQPSDLAILPGDKPGVGYVVGLDSGSGISSVLRFRRQGMMQAPHDQIGTKGIDRIDTDSPVGFAVLGGRISRRFPNGMLVVGNTRNRNFRVFSVNDFELNRKAHDRELMEDKRRDLTRLAQ